MANRKNIMPVAIAFEAALGLAGVALMEWLDVPLKRRLVVSSEVLLRSVLGLAPMLVMLAYVSRSQWRPLAELRRQVEALVGDVFGRATWLELATVSIAAGLGEELLFRGALQPLAVRWLGEAVGLIAVSLVFGGLHALSRAYFVLATLVSLYLGWLAQQYDDLAAPIAIHAVYDFIALVLLQWRIKARDARAEL